jgi:type VI secretion system protein ImpG
MDRRLLSYYNRELAHLREMGAEFAREFPKIAGRLALEDFSCADPYVERLLEGFAFLTSRVQLKLDAEFPRFTQSLMETLYPHYLAPTPSMTVVQLQPDLAEGALADGVKIPRGSAMKSLISKGEPTACDYRTAHDVTLWPVSIAEAQYYTRDLASLELPSGIPTTKAALRLRLAASPTIPFAKMSMDRLAVFIRGAGDVQMRIYEQIFAHGVGIVVQSKGKPVKWREVIKGREIRPIGFDDKEALLPYGARSFSGYRLLHEYFAFPQRFLFFELGGLNAGIRRCADQHVDVVVLLNEPDVKLEGAIDANNFAPFCTPAVNLFAKSADRIHLTEKASEFQVIPDRTKPLDFEVYQVLGVKGHGVRADQEQEFSSFYSARDFDDEAGGAYYTVHRVPRMASSREQRVGQRSKYPGSEVYITLVDSKAAPYRSDLRQLSVSTLCTNRDLPIFLPVGRGSTDFNLQSGGPVVAIRSMTSVPTTPRPSHAEGEMAWRLISHLTLNYLSITDTGGGEGAAGLRDLLELYGNVMDPAIRKQVDGVKNLTSEPAVRRVNTPGPIAFARGLRVLLTLDESAFEGTGVFLLGSVLEQFFAKYVSINSFTETVLKTVERGEVMRWPARMGLRHIL